MSTVHLFVPVQAGIGFLERCLPIARPNLEGRVTHLTAWWPPTADAKGIGARGIGSRNPTPHPSHHRAENSRAEGSHREHVQPKMLEIAPHPPNGVFAARRAPRGRCLALQHPLRPANPALQRCPLESRWRSTSTPRRAVVVGDPSERPPAPLADVRTRRGGAGRTREHLGGVGRSLGRIFGHPMAGCRRSTAFFDCDGRKDGDRCCEWMHQTGGVGLASATNLESRHPHPEAKSEGLHAEWCPRVAPPCCAEVFQCSHNTERPSDPQGWSTNEVYLVNTATPCDPSPHVMRR